MADGDVLTRDSGQPGGSGSIAGEDKFAWSPPAAVIDGHVIEDEGSPLTQRSSLNFVGAGVSAADIGGKTVVTIPGGTGPAMRTITSGVGAAPTAGQRLTVGTVSRNNGELLIPALWITTNTNGLNMDWSVTGNNGVAIYLQHTATVNLFSIILHNSFGSTLSVDWAVFGITP